MAPLLSISLLARAAITAAVMALTMYVVLGLGMSYAAAGGVAAAMTAGMAVGGPLLGRMIDWQGPRTVLLVTVVPQAVFWLSVPILPYGIRLGAALAAGLLMVPAQQVTRQAIAAMTTAGQRQAAFALESMQGELSYVVGPPIVILCAAKVSPAAVAWGVGASIVAGGAPRLALVVCGRCRCGAARRAGTFHGGRRGEPARARQRAGRGDRPAILGAERGLRARIPDRGGSDRPVCAGRRLRGGRAGGPRRRIDGIPALTPTAVRRAVRTSSDLSRAGAPHLKPHLAILMDA
jgi:MFS family permease